MSRRAVVARAGVVLAVAAGVLATASPARAALRESTIGNFWFQDDATGRRDMLEVRQGDQVRFTVRESSTTPHSVQVDELGISSPDLLLFETYTTPPLERPGTYRLYCRAHEDRGHEARLVVRPADSTATSAPPTTSAWPTSSVPPATTASPTSTTPSSTTPASTSPPSSGPSTSSEPSTTLAPVGVGRATDRSRPPPEPGSLAAVLGRRPAEDGPWTRALRLAAAALPVMVTVAALALYAASRREGESGP